MHENSAYFVPMPFSPMHFSGMFAIILSIFAQQICVLLRRVVVTTRALILVATSPATSLFPISLPYGAAVQHWNLSFGMRGWWHVDLAGADRRRRTAWWHF